MKIVSKINNAFTLLELMIAIVISGLVALLAYSAITAGLDTLDRVNAHRRDTHGRARERGRGQREDVRVDAVRVDDLDALAPEVAAVNCWVPSWK